MPKNARRAPITQRGFRRRLDDFAFRKDSQCRPTPICLPSHRVPRKPRPGNSCRWQPGHERRARFRDAHRGGTEGQLSDLRHERDRQPRAARCARRPEALATAHPRGDERPEPHAGRRPREVRQNLRRHQRQLPSPRRERDLSHPGRMARSGTCVTRWWTSRATSARSPACPRRPCGTPRPACRPSPR